MPDALSITMAVAAGGHQARRLLVLGLIVVVIALAIAGLVAARRRLRERHLARDSASSRPTDAA